jgi:hypothetical protein
MKWLKASKRMTRVSFLQKKNFNVIIKEVRALEEDKAYYYMPKKGKETY